MRFRTWTQLYESLRYYTALDTNQLRNFKYEFKQLLEYKKRKGNNIGEK